MIIVDFSVPPGTKRDAIPLSDIVDYDEEAGVGKAEFPDEDSAKKELTDLYEPWFYDDEIVELVNNMVSEASGPGFI